MAYVRKLLVWFYVAFLIMVLSGIVLLFQSNQSSLRTDGGGDKIDLKLDISSKSLQIDLSTAMPGIIVFLIGSSGLILMLIKVPVRAVVGYEQANSMKKSVRDGKQNLNLSAGIPQPVLSETVDRLPLLLWWVIKSKRIAVRIDRK